MTNDDMLAGQQEGAQPVQESGAVSESEAATAPEPSVQNNDQTPEAPASSALEALKPGTVIKGRVRKIVEFGAFVDVGVGRDGLAHVSTLKRAGIDQTLKAGDTVEVVVRRVDVENNRISLAIASPDAESKTALKDLEPNDVVTGRVVRLVDFGAFVDIGARTDGLLHVSQLPYGYVNHPSEVLNVGDEVQVRILEIDTQRRRISLTMKEMGEGGETSAPASSRSDSSRYESSRPASSRQASSRPASSRQATQTQEDSSGERVPTAFEVAFEKARTDAGRRRRASR